MFHNHLLFICYKKIDSFSWKYYHSLSFFARFYFFGLNNQNYEKLNYSRIYLEDFVFLLLYHHWKIESSPSFCVHALDEKDVLFNRIFIIWRITLIKECVQWFFWYTECEYSINACFVKSSMYRFIINVV